MEWAPIIYHLKFDLKMEECWKFKIDGSWSSSLEDHPMIDHLKLYDGSTDYLYGTTRTYMTESSTGTFTQCYIFRVRLKSDHKIDDSGG